MFVYRYNPKANPELPLTPADPPFVQLPPGSGPRHLLFSGDGKHAWLTMEMTAQVAVFDYQDGRLTQRQLVDLADGKPQPGKAAAALHASKDGKFLYVSNRGTTNEILVFAVDPTSGTLKELQRRSVEGDHPRSSALIQTKNSSWSPIRKATRSWSSSAIQRPACWAKPFRNCPWMRQAM